MTKKITDALKLEIKRLRAKNKKLKEENQILRNMAQEKNHFFVNQDTKPKKHF